MLMTLGKSRYSKKEQWEIYRIASKKYTTIIGGVSKLWSYFSKYYWKKNEKVITYADRRYSEGNIYEFLGMKKEKSTNPNYYYFKSGELELKSRINYQKHKLKRKLIKFDSKLTETENMYNN